MLFWVVLFAVSCDRDEINFETPSQMLRFSKDTVFLDTVYNQVRSETYAVKVYNDEDKDVIIPRISLGNGASSLYKINIDGKPGTDFSDIPLRRKDSMYIFVEIAPVANAPEAIAEERINFQLPAGSQHITLFSVVQDAEFFIQNDTNENVLSENTVWTSEKAKIIFGDLTLAEGKSLTVQQGTKVYFHRNSGLKISKNASLQVNGDLNNEVIFRGDRNDSRYDTIPNNWNGIELEEAANAEFNYAKVIGGIRGLSLNKAQANIKNTIFHTHQEFGIYAVNSVVNAENLVMNNFGEAALGIFGGGTYHLTHSTLANYWNLNSSMPGLSIFASNAAPEDGPVAPLTLNVRNSIIYSDKETSVKFDPNSAAAFNYSIQNSLVKHGAEAGFSFEGNAAVTNSLKNEDPLFQHHYTQKMNLRLLESSPAKNLGNSIFASQVPFDILKVSRTVNPSAGAYQ